MLPCLHVPSGLACPEGLSVIDQFSRCTAGCDLWKHLSNYLFMELSSCPLYVLSQSTMRKMVRKACQFGLCAPGLLCIGDAHKLCWRKLFLIIECILSSAFRATILRLPSRPGTTPDQVRHKTEPQGNTHGNLPMSPGFWIWTRRSAFTSMTTELRRICYPRTETRTYQYSYSHNGRSAREWNP